LTRIANPELFRGGVNLALGGGGAKGFVHLGVIEELAEIGIDIKAIVGTSVGAIIGALFAHFSTSMFRDHENAQLEAARAVKDLFLRENFWKYADWNKLSPFTTGLLRGETISEWLANKLYDSEHSRYVRFGDLRFPLTVTATDAHSGGCLIINADKDGSMLVHRAVRASMSIQWAFREIDLEVDGRPYRCWDGGTTGNCRFDVANRIYPGRPTIASSLTYRGDIVETHSSCAYRGRRPRCPAHGDHVIRSMTTGAAHELDGAVGFIF
jgi:predicted acylesterase/phospholipase RssA